MWWVTIKFSLLLFELSTKNNTTPFRGTRAPAVCTDSHLRSMIAVQLWRVDFVRENHQGAGVRIRGYGEGVTG